MLTDYSNIIKDAVVSDIEIYYKKKNEFFDVDFDIFNKGKTPCVLHVRIDDELFGRMYFEGTSNCGCCDKKMKVKSDVALTFHDGSYSLWFILMLYEKKHKKETKIIFRINKDPSVMAMLQSMLFLMPKSEPMPTSMDEHSHIYAIKFDPQLMLKMTSCILYMNKTTGGALQTR